MSATTHPYITPGDHKAFMEYAVVQARLSPPGPDKFCVGAVLVDALKEKLETVYVGIREPNTFVVDNDGKKRLEAVGIGFEMVEGAHDLCYEAAMNGHANPATHCTLIVLSFHSMDPFTALTLATSIVQFVDFATKIVHGTRQIYQTGEGVAEENADIELCASELHNLCTCLDVLKLPSPRSADDDTLCRIADRCISVSIELSSLLEKVKAKDPHSKWQCMVSTVKTQLKKSERDEILARLSQFMAELDSQLSRLTHQYAEIQLRQIFTLPERTQVLITDRRIINLLLFEDMNERFVDISKAHGGNFACALNDRSIHDFESEMNLERHSRDVLTSTLDKSSAQAHDSVEVLVKPLLPMKEHDSDLNCDEKTVDKSSNLPYWLERGAGIFHLTGPGSGKSSLMKYCGTIPRLHHTVGTRKQETTGGLCRPLLHDILEECAELIPLALPELWKQTASTPWQVELKYQLRKEQVCRALTKLLCDPTNSHTHHFVIFIDGLDELEEENSDYEDLIALVFQWIQSKTKHVKLFVSSRPLQEFVDAFSEDQRLCLDQHIRRDHNLFLLDRLQAFISAEDPPLPNQSQRDVEGSRAELSKFTDRITQMCSGDFRKLLWVWKRMRQLMHAGSDPISVTGRLPSLSSSDIGVLVRNLDTLESAFSRVNLDDWSEHTPGFSGKRSLISSGRVIDRDAFPTGAAYQLLTDTETMREIETHLEIYGALEDDLFAAKDARTKGTCEWLLWVTGKPAAGKSILAGNMIEELQGNGEGCSFFFFKYADLSQSQVSTYLRSLASHMASQQASVRESLWEALRETAGPVSDTNNERLLWHKLVVNAIFKTSLGKYFWVIDGLDECENAATAFKTLLSDLDDEIPLRILVTSWDTQTLRTAFAELGSERYCHESISTIDTLPDIRCFVGAKSKALISMNDETRAALVEKIVLKSEGSFLWTSLVLGELSHSYSEDEINQVLDEIPKDMGPLYRRTLDMMSQSAGAKHITKSTIMWTTCATRPLKLNEIQEALNYTGHDRITNLEAMLQATCSQLLMVDRHGNVQLVHETAREFLLGESLDSEFAVRKVAANTQLAKACLQYLLSDEMKRPRKFLDTNVLTWIEVVARTRNLSNLVQTSKHLKEYFALCTAPMDLNFLQTWSTDLIRISARFADALVACPPAIFALIPPLCPNNSAIYNSVHQGRGFKILGSSNSDWGNRLTCVDFRSPTSSLCHGHDYFAVGLRNGAVVLYHAGTGQEYKTLHHGETVNILCFLNRSGLMASLPQRCIALAYDDAVLIAACDKNYLASWNVNDDGSRQPDRPWHAGEEFADSQLRRPPSAVSISLEHNMVAIASLGMPTVLWSLDEDDYYGTCGKKLANGEPSKRLVTALIFNPNSALELLAVSYLDGELVLLDSFNDKTLHTVRANCPKLAASPDGRLIAGVAGSSPRILM
ncbi:hypothetical protein BU24DRAFT_456109 [Aaosphaeria arxii CBS 175.79]|uniref:Uncharacterized protein n=1 Tax=Aaosphaeria arxii CBS 175.79 TaxID=1450172 RepID=A0A6A5X6N9_9PLEO|nr:uncharacterized protein BU24DRAFT_456109 [Aaosphaeria arxii CBS 175.79]KAF2008561.1 hypothetical protein BU24DRAFT_456109 [Aaosphaeria arxii CBS 175.79]